MPATKRTLQGIKERVESASIEIEKIHREGSFRYGQLREILVNDLSPALSDLDYAIEVSD